MDVAKQGFDLAELTAIRSENLRRARKVIDNGDWKDLNAHLLFDFTAGAFVLVGLLKLGNRVVVLIGELPPFWAQLAYVVEPILLEAFLESRELFIDLN